MTSPHQRTAGRAALAVRPGSLQAWAVAMRPRSLPVAVSPVLVGVALAWERSAAIDWLAAALALAAALTMQIVANMQNDVGYTVRGAERGGTRTGLPRATAHGWLTVRHVRLAIVLFGLVGLAIGLALYVLRGWPVLAIGVASLAGALAYMGGPRPIAYTPWGECVVFLFFGLVAVIGTDWVVSGSVGFASVLGGAAIGSLAAAALAVNNHRDIAHDRLVGRRTFAVTFGAPASRRLFGALLFAPFGLLPLLAAVESAPAMVLPLALLPAARQLHRDFLACPPGLAFNAILFRTFRLGLWFASALAAAAFSARAVERLLAG